MTDPVAILRELVAIDSTSAKSNLPILDVLERHARALRFSRRRQTWTDAAGVRKGNLIAHRGAEKGLTPGGVHVRNVAQGVIGRPYNVYQLEG